MPKRNRSARYLPYARGFQRPSEASQLLAIKRRREKADSLPKEFLPCPELFPPVPRCTSKDDWLAQYKEVGQTYEQFLRQCPWLSDSRRGPRGNDTPLSTSGPSMSKEFRGRSICILPIRDFSSFFFDMAALVEYVEIFLNLPVCLLPTVELAEEGSKVFWLDDNNSGNFDSKKKIRQRKRTLVRSRYRQSNGHRQLSVDWLLAKLRPRLPADALCLLALTRHDLYADWSDLFVSGMAAGKHRVGVFSLFRYDPDIVSFSSEFWYDFEMPGGGSMVSSEAAKSSLCAGGGGEREGVKCFLMKSSHRRGEIEEKDGRGGGVRSSLMKPSHREGEREEEDGSGVHHSLKKSYLCDGGGEGEGEEEEGGGGAHRSLVKSSLCKGGEEEGVSGERFYCSLMKSSLHEGGGEEEELEGNGANNSLMKSSFHYGGGGEEEAGDGAHYSLMKSSYCKGEKEKEEGDGVSHSSMKFSMSDARGEEKKNRLEEHGTHRSLVKSSSFLRSGGGEEEEGDGPHCSSTKSYLCNVGGEKEEGDGAHHSSMKPSLPAPGGGEKEGDGRRDAQDTRRRLLLQRACRLVVHEASHLLGVDHCIYFSCCMNGAGHLAEDFAQPMFLCPVDLRKLSTLCDFDVLERYERLRRFFLQQQMFDECLWLDKRLKSLHSLKS